MADFLPLPDRTLLDFGLTPVLHDSRRANARWILAVARQQVTYHLKIDSGMGRLGTRAPAAEMLRSGEGGATCAARRADDPLRLRCGLYTASNGAAGCVFRGSAGVWRHWRYSRGTFICPAPFRSPMAGAIAGSRWYGPAMRSMAMYRRPGDPRPRCNGGQARADVEDGGAGCERGRRRCADRLWRHVPGTAERCGSRCWRQDMRTASRISCRTAGSVIAAGRIVPILGAVSMDLTTIDITGLPGDAGRRRGHAAGGRERCEAGCAGYCAARRDDFIQRLAGSARG